jgi:hypothetical protein
MVFLATAGKERLIWLLLSRFSRNPAVEESTAPVPRACWLPTKPRCCRWSEPTKSELPRFSLRNRSFPEISPVVLTLVAVGRRESGCPSERVPKS